MITSIRVLTSPDRKFCFCTGEQGDPPPELLRQFKCSSLDQLREEVLTGEHLDLMRSLSGLGPRLTSDSYLLGCAKYFVLGWNVAIQNEVLGTGGRRKELTLNAFLDVPLHDIRKRGFAATSCEVEERFPPPAMDPRAFVIFFQAGFVLSRGSMQ